MANFPELKQTFVNASIALAGAMLFEFQHAHPEKAPAIQGAIDQGERMELAIEFGPNGQEIRLSAIGDYESRREIATIHPTEDSSN